MDRGLDTATSAVRRTVPGDHPVTTRLFPGHSGAREGPTRARSPTAASSSTKRTGAADQGGGESWAPIPKGERCLAVSAGSAGERSPAHDRGRIRALGGKCQTAKLLQNVPKMRLRKSTHGSISV